MMRQPCRRAVVWLTCSVLLCPVPAVAHDGPPYPIISNQIAGPWRVSVWTDPDATDDGSLGGKFWVLIDPSGAGGATAADVRAHVSIRPLGRPGRVQSAWTEPVDDNPARRAVALLMDHEGAFAVQVQVHGADGASTVLDAEVQATYDLRPPRIMLLVYLIPFLLAGFLWAKLLMRRRRSQSRRNPRGAPRAL